MITSRERQIFRVLAAAAVSEDAQRWGGVRVGPPHTGEGCAYSAVVADGAALVYVVDHGAEMCPRGVISDPRALAQWERAARGGDLPEDTLETALAALMESAEEGPAEVWQATKYAGETPRGETSLHPARAAALFKVLAAIWQVDAQRGVVASIRMETRGTAFDPLICSGVSSGGLGVRAVLMPLRSETWQAPA